MTEEELWIKGYFITRRVRDLNRVSMGGTVEKFDVTLETSPGRRNAWMALGLRTKQDAIDAAIHHYITTRLHDATGT